MTAILYLDGAEHCSCNLRAHTVDTGGDKSFARGVMRVEPGKGCPQSAAELGDIATRRSVTVRYPFGPAETREATCHYAGGWLLADTKAARAVRP